MNLNLANDFGKYQEANKDLLSSPDRIRVGQPLMMPQLDA